LDSIYCKMFLIMRLLLLLLKYLLPTDVDFFSKQTLDSFGYLTKTRI